MQPVTETHHAHVLLQQTQDHYNVTFPHFKTNIIQFLSTQQVLHLQFPLLLLDHGTDDIQRRVGEAEH